MSDTALAKAGVPVSNEQRRAASKTGRKASPQRSQVDLLHIFGFTSIYI